MQITTLFTWQEIYLILGLNYTEAEFGHYMCPPADKN